MDGSDTENKMLGMMDPTLSADELIGARRARAQIMDLGAYLIAHSVAGRSNVESDVMENCDARVAFGLALLMLHAAGVGVHPAYPDSVKNNPELWDLIRKHSDKLLEADFAKAPGGPPPSEWDHRATVEKWEPEDEE